MLQLLIKATPFNIVPKAVGLTYFIIPDFNPVKQTAYKTSAAGTVHIKLIPTNVILNWFLITFFIKNVF